jgi:hypothetical protein
MQAVTGPKFYKILAIQGHTCADGSKQQQFVDFQDSYSSVASIDSIQVLLALATSK